MQDNRFSILLVLLIFSTSFNLARCSSSQQFESTRDGQKLKANDRRSSGLVPYPRIGRNSEMPSFPRSERSFGMIHQARIGRSDVSNTLNQHHDLSSDTDFYAIHDMDPDALIDLDYEEYANRPIAFKHADKMQKEGPGPWLISPDHIHGYKDLHFAQRIDDPRLYYSIFRGSRNTQGQGGYTPRLGRENEHDAASFL